MAEITRIGGYATFATIPATYNANSGVYIGGPSGTQLIVPDNARIASGLKAGEDLLPGDSIFIFNNLVYASLADGATVVLAGQSATGPIRAKSEGFASEQTQKGEAVTVWAPSVELAYTTTTASGTLAKDYYVSASTKGGLADGPATVSSVVQPTVARYLGDGRIRIK